MNRPPELTDLVLNVRPVSQHALIEIADPGENRACWYAAALMVLAYRGPLQAAELINLKTLARLAGNNGVQPHHLHRLASEAGLEHTPGKALFPRYGAAQWMQALSSLGPLMTVLNSRHLVVVTGVARQGQEWQIVYIDPLVGTAQRQGLPLFNAGVDWRRPILFRRSAHRAPAVLVQPVQKPYSISY